MARGMQTPAWGAQNAIPPCSPSRQDHSNERTASASSTWENFTPCPAVRKYRHEVVDEP